MKNTQHIKLVAVDMDGTLLHENKTISDFSLSVIGKLIRNGVIVVPTTGRHVPGISDTILRVPGIRYAVCGNGSLLVDVVNCKNLGCWPIPMQSAREILQYLKQYPLFYYAHTDKGVFRYCSEEYAKGVKENAPHVQVEENRVDDLAAFIEKENLQVLKIGCFCLDTELYQELLKKGSPCPDLVLMRTGDINFEINHRDASKGNGLKTLCQMLHIPAGQVLAIGDNQNDISMLEWAGVSVAMGNAEEDVKQYADHIADTNEQDGATKFLAEYFQL